MPLGIAIGKRVVSPLGITTSSVRANASACAADISSFDVWNTVILFAGPIDELLRMTLQPLVIVCVEVVFQQTRCRKRDAGTAFSLVTNRGKELSKVDFLPDAS